MKKVALVLCLDIFTVFLILLTYQNAWAIPAFARKYKTSCITCHAIFPRLTAVGEAFRLNGYKLPNDELYVKEKPVSMGAKAYERMFPHSVWPSDIPGLPPIAVVINSDIKRNFNGPSDKKTTFDLPSDASILAAGTFGDDISFFAEFAFDNADNSSEVNAWLMYQGLFGKFIGDNHLNLKVGTVGNQEIGLPNARNDNKITFEDYLYQTALNLDSHPGVEFNGFGHIWRYAVGVVDSGDTSQDNKAYYVAFSLKFGGVGYDGSGGGATGQGAVTGSPVGYWRDNSVHVGAFGYRSYVDNPDAVPVALEAEAYNRVGADIRLNYNDLSLVGGYAWGKDKSKTFGFGSPPEQNIWFAEGDYFIFPWMVGYLRFEFMNVSNSDNSEAEYSNRARFVPGVVCLVRANIKAALEGEFYSEDKFATAAGHGTDFYNSLVLSINWAF
jgi:hypothetical protein